LEILTGFDSSRREVVLANNSAIEEQSPFIPHIIPKTPIFTIPELLDRNE